MQEGCVERKRGGGVGGLGGSDGFGVAMQWFGGVAAQLSTPLVPTAETADTGKSAGIQKEVSRH